MIPYAVIFTVFSLTFRSLPASAILTNITVDDSQTSIIQYTPEDLWNNGVDCSACTAHPNPEDAFEGTWHDSTHAEGSDISGVTFATLQFDGTAIYVYCIIAHTSVSPDGNTDLSFTIDGATAGSFVLAPTNQTTYDYNVLVFSAKDLKSGPHTFVMQNGQPGGAKSLALLDYIVYTHDYDVVPLPVPLSSSSPPVSGSLMSLSQTEPPSPTSQSSIITGSTPIFSKDGISTLIVTSIVTPSSSTSSTVLPSVNSLSTGGPSFSAANVHKSTSTRTIILAVVIPSAVILILLLVGLVWYRKRKARYEHYTPPDNRGIRKDPTISGWTNDAWDMRGSSGISNHGHSSAHGHTNSLFAHPDSSGNLLSTSSPASAGSPLSGSGDVLQRLLPTARFGVGRGRGFTESSVVSTTSYYSDSTQLGYLPETSAALKPYITPDNFVSSAPYATESLSGTRPGSRHPYRARTPDPDDLDNLVYMNSLQVRTASTSRPQLETNVHPDATSYAHVQSDARSEPQRQDRSASRANVGTQATPQRPASPLSQLVHASPLGRFIRAPSQASGVSDAPPAYNDVPGGVPIARDSHRAQPVDVPMSPSSPSDGLSMLGPRTTLGEASTIAGRLSTILGSSMDGDAEASARTDSWRTINDVKL